jgi:RNA polymerase sigma-70 factor (ECF subfamily)
MTGEQTCWTLVEGAAAGEEIARDRFARTYLSVVRAFLAARWSGSAMISDLDDAVQEAFLECLKEGGALQNLETPREGKFRTYLYAVVSNVARRFEERRAGERKHRVPVDPSQEPITADEARLSRIFDQAWTKSLLQRAAERQEAEAKNRGAEAVRRVELMKLRFGEDQPIREIARRWEIDPDRLHHEYAKAREEFKQALVAEISFHQPCSLEEAERLSLSLLDLLR